MLFSNRRISGNKNELLETRRSGQGRCNINLLLGTRTENVVIQYIDIRDGVPNIGTSHMDISRRLFWHNCQVFFLRSNIEKGYSRQT